MPPEDEPIRQLTAQVNEVGGRLTSLEDRFTEHRREMREDIKDGFKQVNKSLSGKIDQARTEFDKGLRQAHGRMKSQDEKLEKQVHRLSAVEKSQGRLVNWKHYVVGITGGIVFLILTLPPAIKNIWELFQVLLGW